MLKSIDLQLGFRTDPVLAANDAKKWSIIGIVVGVIGSILYFVCFGGLAALSAMTGAN